MVITLSMVEERLDSIERDVSVLQQDVMVLRQDVSILRREFDAFRPYVNQQFEQLHSDIAELKQDMKRAINLLEKLVGKLV